MITVRIARAGRRDQKVSLPGRAPTHVVILADEADGRELPLWFLPADGFRLQRLLEAEPEWTADALTARMLRALGATVTAVEIDELGPEVAAARIGLAGPAGTRQITARLVEGLAVAIAADAPLRVADTVMGRLAVPSGTTPVRAGGPGGGRRPVHGPRRSARPRYEPRNTTFADGLDGWLFGGSFTENVSASHWHDYQCIAEGGTAVIASAVPEPTGFAMLGQEVYADDYRGSTVILRGELRVPAGRAGLFLRVNQGRPIRGPLTEQAAFADPDNNVTPVANDPGWALRQISARVPAHGDAVVFGIFLAGPGRIELRNPGLLRVTS